MVASASSIAKGFTCVCMERFILYLLSLHCFLFVKGFRGLGDLRYVNLPLLISLSTYNSIGYIMILWCASVSSVCRHRRRRFRRRC